MLKKYKDKLTAFLEAEGLSSMCYPLWAETTTCFLRKYFTSIQSPCIALYNGVLEGFADRLRWGTFLNELNSAPL